MPIPVVAGEHRLRRLLVQQRPCSAQDRRIEPLGEAIVDRCQKLPHLVMAALGHAQARKADGNAQLPKQSTLLRDARGRRVCRLTEPGPISPAT